MRKLACLVALGLSALAGCAAQVPIKGLVRDKDTGGTVVGARVTFGPYGPYTSTTNSQGEYSLTAVHRAETYTVSVEANGYHTFTDYRVVAPSGNGSPVVMSFEIAPQERRGHGGGGPSINVVTTPVVNSGSSSSASYQERERPRGRPLITQSGRRAESCPECGTERPETANFCPGCGAGWGHRTMPPRPEPTCAACGAAKVEGARFCGECGVRY